MKNNFIGQIVVALILVGVAVFLLNPFNIFMPDMMVMLLSACIVIAFATYTGFIMREEVGDEREVFHRMFAGRTAFLVGLAVLLIGVGVESWTHHVDPWLVGTLVSMIVTKIIVRIYTDKNL